MVTTVGIRERASQPNLRSPRFIRPIRLLPATSLNIYLQNNITATYDHRLKRKGHPVRSAILKLQIGGLVVRWVTTSEYPLLYVFFLFLGGLLWPMFLVWQWMTSTGLLQCPQQTLKSILG